MTTNPKAACVDDTVAAIVDAVMDRFFGKGGAAYAFGKPDPMDPVIRFADVSQVLTEVLPAALESARLTVGDVEPVGYVYSELMPQDGSRIKLATLQGKVAQDLPNGTPLYAGPPVAGEAVRDALLKARKALPVLRTMLKTAGLAGADVADEIIADIERALAVTATHAGQDARKGGDIGLAWYDRKPSPTERTPQRGGDLPDPAFRLRWDHRRAAFFVDKPNVGDTDCYTAEQMRAYALSASAARSGGDAEDAALEAQGYMLDHHGSDDA